MYINVLILIVTLFLAREISGYDSRYNIRKHFVLKNNEMAKLLLPKRIGSRSSARRSKSDFNKMTYVGAIFYFCNLILLLSIPIFFFLVPEIQVHPYVFQTRYIYISVDTLNEKLPVLFFLILMAIETVFELFNVIAQAKKQSKKWLFILSIILITMVILFGLLQIGELVKTFIEVL